MNLKVVEIKVVFEWSPDLYYRKLYRILKYKKKC